MLMRCIFCVLQDINKRLSLPADMRLPESFLVKQAVSPTIDGPLNRRLRRASLVSRSMKGQIEVKAIMVLSMVYKTSCAKWIYTKLAKKRCVIADVLVELHKW